MIQYLSYAGFEWVKAIEEFNLENIKEDSDVSHILEVDLEYPKELHDKHNEYPYCPEHITVTEKMLSNYQKDVAMKHQIKMTSVKKLIPTLEN